MKIDVVATNSFTIHIYTIIFSLKILLILSINFLVSFLEPAMDTHD